MPSQKVWIMHNHAHTDIHIIILWLEQILHQLVAGSWFIPLQSHSWHCFIVTNTYQLVQDFFHLPYRSRYPKAGISLDGNVLCTLGPRRSRSYIQPVEPVEPRDMFHGSLPGLWFGPLASNLADEIVCGLENKSWPQQRYTDVHSSKYHSQLQISPETASLVLSWTYIIVVAAQIWVHSNVSCLFKLPFHGCN